MQFATSHMLLRARGTPVADHVNDREEATMQDLITMT